MCFDDAVVDDNRTKDAHKTDQRKENPLDSSVKLLNQSILLHHLEVIKSHLMALSWKN